MHRDLVYSSVPGYRPLELDLYVPAAPVATCLYLHGGGWRVGSRRLGPGRSASWTPSFFEQVAAYGLAVASVDYRLSSEAIFPAQRDDVQAAADFLVNRGAEFGLPGPLVVWGGSAGGQLGALHALRAVGSATEVSAVVCWYPATDLDALSADIAAVGGVADRSADSREGRLVGGALDDRRELVASASPTNAVPDAAQLDGRTLPPFLFLHGSADVSVPPRQSERLADVLLAAGGAATVELIEGATHIFPELDDAATLAVVHRSATFLRDAV